MENIALDDLLYTNEFKPDINEKKEDIYFKYMPKKITKKTFGNFRKNERNNKKESPFDILKDLQLS